MYNETHDHEQDHTKASTTNINGHVTRHILHAWTKSEIYQKIKIINKYKVYEHFDTNASL